MAQSTGELEAPARRLARLLSDIFNPLFVAFPTFLIISLAKAPDVFHGLLWWIIAMGGTSLAPLFFVRRGVRLGHYSDLHVSVREQRIVPLLFALACMLIVFLLLYLLGASQVVVATMSAVIVTCSIALVITRYWKISLHLVGIAGSVTAFILLFGLAFFFLAPLVVLIGWARWQVGAHTPLQAVAGTALAVAVTMGIFWLFGIY